MRSGPSGSPVLIQLSCRVALFLWEVVLGGAKGRILNGSRSPVTLGTIEVVALGSPTIKRMILISPTISTGIQTNQRSKIFLDNI